jgi:hypothetical protein
MPQNPTEKIAAIPVPQHVIDAAHALLRARYGATAGYTVRALRPERGTATFFLRRGQRWGITVSLQTQNRDPRQIHITADACSRLETYGMWIALGVACVVCALVEIALIRSLWREKEITPTDLTWDLFWGAAFSGCGTFVVLVQLVQRLSGWFGLSRATLAERKELVNALIAHVRQLDPPQGDSAPLSA